MHEGDRTSLPREAPNFQCDIRLGCRLLASRTHDPILQRKEAKHGVPPPSTTLPQDNPADPTQMVALFDLFAPSPGDHECVLRGVFGRAQVIQNEIRKLQHWTRAFAQHALKGGPSIYPSAGGGLVAHARHSNRALGWP
jgi:hypothetical protein